MTYKELFEKVKDKFGDDWQVVGTEPTWDDEASSLFAVKRVIDKVKILVYFQCEDESLSVYKFEVEAAEYRANPQGRIEFLALLLQAIATPDVYNENAKLKADAAENENVIQSLRRTAAELRGKFIAAHAGQDVLQDTVLKAIAGAK